MRHAILPALARAAALSLAALLPVTPSWAQNATNGEVVYGKTIVVGVKSCLACHGTPKEDPVIIRGASALRIKTAVQNQARMMPLNGFITDAEYNDMAAYIGKTLGVTPTFIDVVAKPSVSVSATALSFASQNVGTTSPAQTVTVSNAASATAALTFTSIATTAGSDFSVSGGSCSTSAPVAAGGSCTVNLVFKPTAAGTRNGTLTLMHNGTGGKSDVSLSGNGMAATPAVSLSPTTLSFSSVVGTPTAPMRVVLSNTGSGSLTLSALSLGGTQASDFALASTSTCAANGSVAGGSSCNIDIVFTPGATGARAATLTVAHNAAGSPATVTLAGTGTASPQAGIAVDATTLDLGNQVVEVQSAPKTLTVTNSGAAPLSFSSLSLSGTDAGSFVLGGSCAVGTPVAAKGSCTVTVAMLPLTLGTKVATLTLASNAPTGPVAVALRGVAIKTPAPEVGLSQAALDFGTVTLGVKSNPRTVTLTNIGTAALGITSIVSSSSEFGVTHNCPASLPVAASCGISVTFTPASANLAESVIITTNAASSPNSIVLTGLGTRATMPVLVWQPASPTLTFASTVVGVASATQTLTLVNQGPGAALINALGVAGADASAFAIGASSTCKVGLSLDVNASCTVVVSFVPGSTGPKTASLQVASNATPPGDVPLSGSGASPSTGSGSITVSPLTLDFSSIGVMAGQTSSSLTVAVSNGSAAAVTVSKVALTGPFSLVKATSNDCGAAGFMLSPGGSCNLAVVFAPTAAGSGTGTLSLSTSSNQTVDVTLKGQANAATPKLAWQGNVTALPFSTTLVGQTSAAQTLTLTNPGTVAATISSVTLTGTDAAAFALSPASTCKANASVAAGGSCTVVLAFAPASAGAKSATLKVASNATGLGDVVLSGNGMMPAPALGMLTVNKTALDFSGTSVDVGQTSAAMNVTVSNGNVAAVVLSKVEVTGPFKVTASTCPAAPMAIAVSGTCSLSVAFMPTASGMASGSLMLTTAANQMLVVALQGLSTAPAPVLAWQTGGVTALQLDATEVGRTSATKSVTLLNQGPGAVRFTALEASGTDAAQFVLTSASTCRVGTSLDAGASCQLVVAFMPTAAGSKSAVLRIASNAIAPAPMNLAGVASAPSAAPGMLATDFSSLGFMAAKGNASSPQVVTLKNTGASPLMVTNFGTTGPFQVVNSATGGCSLPQSLAPGASCTLSVVFNAPATEGDATGQLLVDTAGGERRALSLTGRAMVTNAGGSSNNGGGGGASAPWALLALGLAALALPGRTHRPLRLVRRRADRS